MFYFEKINNKSILKTDFIQVAHAFFTTREAVMKSKEPETVEIVEQNKHDVASYLNVNLRNFVSPTQTHSANIQEAKEGILDYPDTDGLILTNPKLAIYLNFADCTPLIFYDEFQNIGAVSHAGWRGTAQKIGVKTVERMINHYGSAAENIKVVIGPAISLCCYDVGEEVLNKLSETVKNFDGLSEMHDGKIFVDLKGINKRQLNEVGVGKIEVCPYCTVCDNGYFYSYRKENGTSNRHSAVLKLR